MALQLTTLSILRIFPIPMSDVRRYNRVEFVRRRRSREKGLFVCRAVTTPSLSTRQKITKLFAQKNKMEQGVGLFPHKNQPPRNLKKAAFDRDIVDFLLLLVFITYLLTHPLIPPPSPFF